jgi:hypothetical protein
MTATTTRPTPTHRRADQASRLWHLLIVVMLWIAYTFIRGALVGWYPYPFMDVDQIGSWASILNTAFVLVVAVVLVAIVTGLDRCRTGLQQGPVLLVRRPQPRVSTEVDVLRHVR